MSSQPPFSSNPPATLTVHQNNTPDQAGVWRQVVTWRPNQLPSGRVEYAEAERTWVFDREYEDMDTVEEGRAANVPTTNMSHAQCDEDAEADDEAESDDGAEADDEDDKSEVEPSSHVAVGARNVEERRAAEIEETSSMESYDPDWQPETYDNTEDEIRAMRELGRQQLIELAAINDFHRARRANGYVHPTDHYESFYEDDNENENHHDNAGGDDDKMDDDDDVRTTRGAIATSTATHVEEEASMDEGDGRSGGAVPTHQYLTRCVNCRNAPTTPSHASAPPYVFSADENYDFMQNPAYRLVSPPNPIGYSAPNPPSNAFAPPYLAWPDLMNQALPSLDNTDTSGNLNPSAQNPLSHALAPPYLVWPDLLNQALPPINNTDTPGTLNPSAQVPLSHAFAPQDLVRPADLTNQAPPPLANPHTSGNSNPSTQAPLSHALAPLNPVWPAPSPLANPHDPGNSILSSITNAATHIPSTSPASSGLLPRPSPWVPHPFTQNPIIIPHSMRPYLPPIGWTSPPDVSISTMPAPLPASGPPPLVPELTHTPDVSTLDVPSSQNAPATWSARTTPASIFPATPPAVSPTPVAVREEGVGQRAQDREPHTRKRRASNSPPIDGSLRRSGRKRRPTQKVREINKAKLGN